MIALACVGGGPRASAAPSESGLSEAPGAAGSPGPTGNAAGSSEASTARSPRPDSPRWCAPELESLGDDVCLALPGHTHGPPRELVIFLHGVIAPEGQWQWAQQRSAARAATARGVAVLMPPGRTQLRTDSMRDWITWPTSAVAQRRVEHEVLEQWRRARSELEQRLGRPFERTYVIGFSNGAYYVSSLALRGRLPVDGYGAFAGGIVPGPVRVDSFAGVPRVPFYVGYGGRDPAARKDCRTFEQAFRVLRWPGRVVVTKKGGHVMADAQVKAALEFFRAQHPLDADGGPTTGSGS